MKSNLAKNFLFGVIYFSLISLCACGYTSRSMISDEYRTIYIKPFTNRIDITQETDVASKYKINRPYLETDLTKQVVNKFMWDGNLRPVKVESADLILEGEIVEFRKDPLRYTQSDEVEEYRVNLIVNLTMYKTGVEKPLWQENNFTGDTTYFVTGTSSITEAQAITNAITDLARRIVERTVEEW